MAQYQYQAKVDIISGGYDGEEVNVIPQDETPHVTDVMSGNETYQYYYRDSQIPSNANSSRVVFTIQDQWTASISSMNVLTVTCHTIITSIVRDSLVPGAGQVTAGLRNIYLYGEQGPNYTGLDFKKSFLNDQISTAHTISSAAIDMGTNVLTLQPGEQKGRGTVYILNYVSGHENEPIPNNPNIDALYVGTYFTNILPADYRPGKVWNGSAWLSTNRATGAANIRNASSLQTMRTIGGPTATGNPPLIRNASAWENMRLIGQQ